MTLEVVHRHEKNWRRIWRRIYGADFWSRFLQCVSGALRKRGRERSGKTRVDKLPYQFGSDVAQKIPIVASRCRNNIIRVMSRLTGDDVCFLGLGA